MNYRNLRKHSKMKELDIIQPLLVYTYHVTTRKTHFMWTEDHFKIKDLDINNRY